MSSITLSTVLEKQIRRLCLNDFPCGFGSWRKVKDGTGGGEAEKTDALLDLLSCRGSPWWYNETWSPQAQALRRLAVQSPECLHSEFICNYFSTLRIVDKGVTVIDNGLLKFSKLEELILSANTISEIPVENLPSTLKILDLRANQLSSLNSLTSRTPPRLQYLGLSSTGLGSCDDVAHLTGTHWPQLVCLDLSDCEFQDQGALMRALNTLPSLRTLVLEGNPFTLARCYPGFTVDSLPWLSCLDASWISPEEKHRFRGLAKRSDVTMDYGYVTVSVGRMRGIPDPLMNVEENAPEYPVITYSYSIIYSFQKTLKQEADGGSKADTAESTSDADLLSNQNPGGETSESELITEDDISPESTHRTLKLKWSDCVYFCHSQTHRAQDLRGLKKCLIVGFFISIEQEKILSWPANAEDTPLAKPVRNAKDKKGGKEKEPPSKPDPKQSKAKDKKKKAVIELVQDAPIRRILSTMQVPMKSLIKGASKLSVLCDFGPVSTDAEKLKEDKKTGDTKQRGGTSAAQKSTATSKGKGKGRKEDTTSVQSGPVTVELCVELQRCWSASEATMHPSHQTM